MPLRTAEGTFSSSDNANNTLMVQNPATIHELTTTVEQIVLLSKSTLSPDEDLQYAVEKSRLRAKKWVNIEAMS